MQSSLEVDTPALFPDTKRCTAAATSAGSTTSGACCHASHATTGSPCSSRWTSTPTSLRARPLSFGRRCCGCSGLFSGSFPPFSVRLVCCDVPRAPDAAAAAEAAQTLDFKQLEATAFLSRKFFRLGRFIRYEKCRETRHLVAALAHSCQSHVPQRGESAADAVAVAAAVRGRHVAASVVARARALGGGYCCALWAVADRSSDCAAAGVFAL